MTCNLSLDISKFILYYLNFKALEMFSGLMSGGATNMRGLNEFISDIRECKDKESETKRV